MAGIDQEYRGEAALAPGATVGMLEQEPILDETKDVKGNVEDGVAETKALLDRFNELAANYSEETRRGVRRHPGQDRRRRRLEPRHAAGVRDGRPAPAPAGRRGGHPLRGRAPARGAMPAAAARARTAAARRAHQPPRRRVGGLAGAAPGRVQGGTSWRSPTTATSSTTSPAGSSSSTAARASPTRATTRAGSSRSRPAWPRRSARRRARQRTIAAELEWVRTNPKGRRTKSKARLARYEELVAEERNVKLEEVQIHIPPGPAPGREGAHRDQLSQGLRRPPADRGRCPSTCPAPGSSA